MGGSPTRQDGDLSSRSLMGQYDQYGGAAILTSYSHVNREPDDIPRDFWVPYLIIFNHIIIFHVLLRGCTSCIRNVLA
jgi:hypothetical protein